MCCTFDTETRKRWALCITILSALVALGGCVMVGLSVKFYTDEDGVWSADMGDLNEQMDQVKGGVFAVLLIFSVVAIIVGAFGMCCGCPTCSDPEKCCHKGYPILYGIILSLVWIVYFVIGGIVTTLATQVPDEIQKSCAGEGNPNLEQLIEVIDTIDTTVGSYSGQLMCSYLCPCDQDLAQPWTDMSESDLNNYKRTKNPVTLGQQSNNNPMTDDDDNYRLVVYPKNGNYNGKLYENFIDCHRDLEEKKKEQEEAQQQDENNARRLQTLERLDESQQNYEFVPTGTAVDTGLAVLAYFEQKYECSGICESSLFYYELDLTAGRPKTTCLLHVKEEVEGSLTYLGITSVIIGVICLLIWVCQYSLWCNYTDKDSDKQRSHYDKN